MKWIFLSSAFFLGEAAFFIKNTEPQIETAQHFYQPLMKQGFRYDYQCAICTLGDQLLMFNDSFQHQG